MSRKYSEALDGYKIVKFTGIKFAWKGTEYDLRTITAAKLKKLIASDWPFIEKVTPKTKKN